MGAARQLADGAKADPWRKSNPKCDPGWPGPCEVIKDYKDGSKAVVDWRSHITPAPINPQRKHAGPRDTTTTTTRHTLPST
eukprot:6389047-Pyramimonas_sp.AAC.1